LAAVYANSSVTKIGPGFAVPGAELDDVDLVTGRADKIFSKIAGKPARLQLEFVRCAQRKKKRAFVDTSGDKKFGVACSTWLVCHSEGSDSARNDKK